jgi:hypothetical protein
MAKSSGLGWTTFSVDDAAGTPVAIRNDITNLQFATPRGVQDVTGLDKSANERLLLLADASYTLTGVFNPTLSHGVFKTVPSTSVPRTVSSAIASQTLAMEILFTDYNFNRGNDGAFTFSAPGVLADGTVPAWS